MHIQHSNGEKVQAQGRASIYSLCNFQEDINVICVDWMPGAKSPYLSASANARLVRLFD